MPITILINGAKGRMGRVIAAEAPGLGVTVAGSNATQALQFSTPGSSSPSYPIWIIELLVLAFAVIAVAIIAVALIARRRPPPPPH